MALKQLKNDMIRSRRLPKGFSHPLHNPFWPALALSLGAHGALWFVVPRQPLEAALSPEALKREQPVNVVDLPVGPTLTSPPDTAAVPPESLPPEPPSPFPFLNSLPNFALPPLPPLPRDFGRLPDYTAPSPPPTVEQNRPASTPAATPDSTTTATPGPTPARNPTPGVLSEAPYNRNRLAQEPSPSPTNQIQPRRSGSEVISILNEWYRLMQPRVPPGETLMPPETLRLPSDPVRQQEFLESKRITGWEPPVYPEQACGSGARGEVIAVLAVDPAGRRFSEPEVLQTTGSSLVDEAVRQAVLKLEYGNSGREGYRVLLYVVSMEPPTACPVALPTPSR